MIDLEKVVSAVLRGLTTAFIGGTGYQLFDGRWFGETIFSTYLQQQAAVLLTGPATDDLYSSFAAQSVPLAMQNASAALIFVSLVLLLVLFAHIVSKPTIAKLRATLPPIGQHRGLLSLLWNLYVRFQEFVTVCLFLVLTSLFFFWPSNCGLAIAFLLIVIAGAFYCSFTPPTSRAANSPNASFTCASSLFSSSPCSDGPGLYAQRHFDPDFALASSGGTLDHCDESRLFKGPT